MKENFEGKDILVTGGCGSIGSEIVKQLISYNPRRIRVFDNSESGHFYLNQKLGSDKIRNLLGDVRDRDRIFRAMEGVDVVFHAAALKHVPFCEYNPFEAVYTNIIGTKHVVEAAVQNKVGTVIGISTDKAVNPINTMGATKLLSERIIINAPLGESPTRFACVRFGNVLDSTGSVIPIFREQISKGGPVTVTSDEMTRFFMTIPQAVTLTLEAANKVKGREIFILKMNALNIRTLAEALIEEFSDGHIPIEIVGVRPGEKLYEVLFTEEELPFIMEEKDMFVLKNSPYDKSKPKEQTVSHEYSSLKADLLSKESIKELLRNAKII